MNARTPLPDEQSWRSLRVPAELRSEFDALYADYASALDERRYSDWLKFFFADCHYKVQPRENHDRGLPLATLAFESIGMLKDRVFGVEETLIHQPYTQLHVFGPLRFIEYQAPQTNDAQLNGKVIVQCNYSVFRVKLNHLPEVFNLGRYVDEWGYSESGWKLQNKLVVFDSDLIANSIIYPL